MADGTSVLNLSIFSSAEKQQLLTAVKAEILVRITGRVQNGSSTGQSFGVELYSSDALNRLANALTADLGLDTQMQFVRPNFNHGYGNCGSGFNP